jgi:hypothetical protein
MILQSCTGDGATELVLAVAHPGTTTDRQGAIVDCQSAAADCQHTDTSRQGAVVDHMGAATDCQGVITGRQDATDLAASSLKKGSRYKMC